MTSANPVTVPSRTHGNRNADAISRKNRRTNWLERKLSSLLMRQLSELRNGSLTIHDSDGSHRFGATQDEAGAAVMAVHDPRFYRRIATSGSLGAAESFLNGEWTSPDLVTLLRILSRNADTLQRTDGGLPSLANRLLKLAAWAGRNTRSGSRRNIAAHYDLGNEFFELFLDETMMYSSALFKTPDDTLEQASQNKLERICQRLQLQASDHLLEIGTGWGGLALHAARNYGCRVTTTTISPKQHDHAARLVAASDSRKAISLLQEDYRDLRGEFDKLVSIEMIEAVGQEFLELYFQTCHRLVKPGGRMVIQAIVMPSARYEQYARSIDFIQKYIFPGGFLPSLSRIEQAVERCTAFRLVDSEDLSDSYARTLHEWRARFFNQIDRIRKMGFSETFIRTWDYYFSYCEAAFLERAVQVFQLEWIKPTEP